MKQKVSAGLLMYRMGSGKVEVFLAHPGGPFFKKKDQGCWTIPKGEIESAEDLLKAAIREFKEETGVEPVDPFLPLGKIIQKSGKVVHAWAFEGRGDYTSELNCQSTFTIEWPPRSGEFQTFPEVDRVDFFEIPAAKEKLMEAQHPFLDNLLIELQKMVSIPYKLF